MEIEQIHLSFLPVSNRFRLEGEDRQGHHFDLSLSRTVMQSLMGQIEALACESIIENLED